MRLPLPYLTKLIKKINMKKIKTVKLYTAIKHTTGEAISKRVAYSADTSSHGKKHVCRDSSLISHKFKSVTSVEAATSPAPLSLPIYDCTISAGFPSPAQDWCDLTLDLNRLLVQNPAATFFIRAPDDSMNTMGIFDGDLLIVDRSLPIKHQPIVIASVNGDLTVKRLVLKNGKTLLKAENPFFMPIELTEEMDVSILGVVTYVIHSLHN